MTKNLKIAISGAHSQGKTTLIKDLILTEQLRKFQVLGNITRGIKELGIPICEGGSNWSQALVIAKHIEHYFTKGNCLLDRCLLDGIAYTEALYTMGKIDDWTRNYALTVTDKLLRQGDGYNQVFYVKPELPLADDGVRTIDRTFFDLVVLKFEQAIVTYNVDVIELSGSREQRVATVIKTLKDKFSL